MKFKISQNGNTFDFFFHDNDKRAGKGALEILKGQTYPIIKNVVPKVICDVGANIGATSVFFARNYKEAKIFSFEPASINFKLLEQNIKDLKNVFALNCGVFDKDTTEKIYIDKDSPGRNSIFKHWTNTKEFEQIRLINFHYFLKKNKIENIDILKIDTEGCEVLILRSIIQYIPNIKLLYLEYHSKEDKNAIKQLLNKTHFVLRDLLVGMAEVDLDENALERKCLENVFQENEVIIKKGDIVKIEHLHRLRSVKKKKILVRSKDLGEIIFLNKLFNK